MEPERKLRTSPPLTFPGGGGINVSRVAKVLGGIGISIFTAGRATGQLLRELVDQHGLLTRVVPISGWTRVSTTAFERSTGQEYRITPPGPELNTGEWEACLGAALEFESSYIVATGSLPRGVPADFYARLAHEAKRRSRRVVLDCSGDALKLALDEGVYAVKPNARELRTLFGRMDDDGPDALEHMAGELVASGKAEIVAVSMGAEGALLCGPGGSLRIATPKVEVKSAVGAGDSFVGGMIMGLARDLSVEDAFALGVAAGSAAVLTAGSELCRREDVERLYLDIAGRPLAI